MQVPRKRSMWEGTRGREAPFMASVSPYQILHSLAPWGKGSASDGVSSFSLQPAHWASSINFLLAETGSAATKLSLREGSRALTVLTRQLPQSRNFPLLKHFPAELQSPIMNNFLFGDAEPCLNFSKESP